MYCIPGTVLSVLCVLLFNSHANPMMYVDYCLIIVILLYYKRAKKTTE